MSLSKPRAVALAMGVTLGAAACGDMSHGNGGTSAVLERLEPVARTCPRGSLASIVAVDRSLSARNQSLDAIRSGIVSDRVTRAAVCGGEVTLLAFSASVSDSALVYRKEFARHGATRASRLIRADRDIRGAIDMIDESFPAADAALTGDGTDVVGQLDLIAEQRGQLPPDAVVDVTVITDGVSSRGTVLNVRNLTIPRARSLAASATVPSLTGADVTFVGIGRTSGKPAPTAFVQAMKEYYRVLCVRTSAKSCDVMTDFSGEVNA